MLNATVGENITLAPDQPLPQGSEALGAAIKVTGGVAPINIGPDLVDATRPSDRTRGESAKTHRSRRSVSFSTSLERHFSD